jgi:hypothetical protein
VSRIAALLLISTVLVSPIPFGSIHDWAWALGAVALGVAATAFILSRDARPFMAEWRERLSLPTLGFAAVLAWIAVQLLNFVPLPSAHPVSRADAGDPGAGPRNLISLDPDATLDGLVHLASYALVFVLAVALGRGRASAAIRLFALGGLAIALYAIVSWHLAPDWVLWKKKESYLEAATGTFLNRNTFATYAGLVLLAITAVILTRKHQSVLAAPPNRHVGWFLAILVLRIEENWFWIFAWMTVLFALLLSGSRAGTLSTVMGVIILVVLARRHEGDRVQPGATAWWRRKALASLVLGVTVVYLAGGNYLTARIADRDIGAQAEERLAIYELTLRAIADAFWTGTGLGTFPRLFATYRTTHPSLQPGSEFAHNTFLDMASGLGVPAALAFYAVLAYCAYQCLRGVRRRRLGRVYPALGVAATIMAGVHSLFDFSLEIPAVAMAYAFLLGLGFGQAWPPKPAAKGIIR